MSIRPLEYDLKTPKSSHIQNSCNLSTQSSDPFIRFIIKNTGWRVTVL